MATSMFLKEESQKTLLLNDGSCCRMGYTHVGNPCMRYIHFTLHSVSSIGLYKKGEELMGARTQTYAFYLMLILPGSCSGACVMSSP